MSGPSEHTGPVNTRLADVLVADRDKFIELFMAQKDYSAEAEKCLNAIGTLFPDAREKVKAKLIKSMKTADRKYLGRNKGAASAFQKERADLMRLKSAMESVAAFHKEQDPLTWIHASLMEEKLDLLDLLVDSMIEYCLLWSTPDPDSIYEQNRTMKKINVLKIRIGEVDAKLPARLRDFSAHVEYRKTREAERKSKKGKVKLMQQKQSGQKPIHKHQKKTPDGREEDRNLDDSIEVKKGSG